MTAKEFIRLCKTELKWEDLSKDTVVMDVGSGIFFSCCTEIIELFPNVGCVIALDKDKLPDWLYSEGNIRRLNECIQLCQANIEEWDSLREFDGKINTIVSRHVLQQVRDVELALKNIYRMLKPGGDVGITFYLNSLANCWIKKIASVSKWEQFQVSEFLVFFPGNLDSEYYKEMMERIGFLDVRSEKRESTVLYCTNNKRLEKLFRVRDHYFSIPEELTDEFQKESMTLLRQVVGSGENTPIQYTNCELYLFAVKPSASCVSKEEKN